MAFSAEWLALREPADHAARDAGLLARAAQVAGDGGVILDLGAGSGSTLRAFAGLRGPQRWRQVDADAGLLALAPAGAERVVMDLRDLDHLPLEGVTLVTASALIDLVSEGWLAALLARVVARNLPFYAALSYDGRMEWEPALPEDAAVTRAFNVHQRGDKGFGPALGPTATGFAAGLLRAAGYAVMQAHSPWQLTPDDAALQAALLPGIAAAAAEAGAPCDTARWCATRQAMLGQGTCRIGHLDLLALPPPTPSTGG